MIKGVDLSAFQTDIDWDKAHKKIEYAILRATTKNNKPDNQFYEHAANCELYGVPYDVYKYMYAVSYTHLDVYKRQVIGMVALPSANTGKFNIYNIPRIRHVNTANGYHTVRYENNSCLLYTSL